MKLVYSLLLIALIVIPASAQSSLHPDTKTIEDFVAESYGPQPAEWYDSLSTRLAKELNQSTDSVTATSVHAAIVFALYHSDHVRMEKLVPALVRIIHEHPDERFRMMGLVALHAIGGYSAIDALYVASWTDKSERVRKMASAALRDWGWETTVQNLSR